MGVVSNRVLVAAYVTCAVICAGTVAPSKAEIMYNEKKPSECSIEALVDFIDQSLAQSTINASEFDSKFIQMKPDCRVDVAQAVQIAWKSRFFGSISRGGPYGRSLVVVFRTRVNGQ